ncbi:unnamed protein product, partial [Oikopleura dioica]
AKLRVKINNMI